MVMLVIVLCCIERKKEGSKNKSMKSWRQHEHGLYMHQLEVSKDCFITISISFTKEILKKTLQKTS